MTSFLYRLSPREFIRIAGSLPFLPQRLIVSGETRKTSATSRTVKRSGKLSSDTEGLFLVLSDIVVFKDYTIVERECQIYFVLLN